MITENVGDYSILVSKTSRTVYTEKKKLEGKGEMREIVNGYSCTIDAITYFLSFETPYFFSRKVILKGEVIAFQRDFLLYLMTWLVVL